MRSMDVLFATDGRPPAVAAGELLRRLVVPSHVDVTVLHASEFGNEVVAESYARDVLAAAEASLGGAGSPLTWSSPKATRPGAS